MSDLRDSALPGLAQALDAETMQRRLSREIPECRTGLRLQQLRILSVQYDPGRRCSIVWRARFRDESGRRRDQRLAALLLPAGARMPTPSRVGHLAAAGTEGLPVRTTAIPMPEIGLTVYPYPFDPFLGTLADAGNPESVVRELDGLWRRRGVRPRRASVALLGYTPFARAALEYEVLSEGRTDGIPELRRLVAKLDAQRPAGEIFARSWAVWRAAAGRVELVPPVGYLASLNVSLQERLDGPRLTDVAADGRFKKWVRQTARSVAELHQLQLPVASGRTGRRDAASVSRYGGVLAAIRPRIARRVKDLARRIASDLESRAVITGPIHADLHPANLIVANGRVTLIDLDNLSRGDRLLDVGRFLSALRTTSFRIHGHPGGLDEAGRAFLETYMAASAEDETRVRLYEAACLLTSAATGFRLQRDGWQRSADLLVDEAERSWQQSRGGGPTARKTAASPPVGPRAPHDWATDVAYVKAVLDRPVLDVYGARIDSCRVVRDRSAARLRRVRFRLSGRAGDRPWSRIVEGAIRSGGHGGGAWRRLSTLATALESEGSCFLPRPVAFVRELGMVVVEPPRGRSLWECEADDRARAVLPDELARRLSAVHRAGAVIDRRRELDRELSELQRCAAGIEERRVPGASLAAALCGDVSARLSRVAPRFAPTFRRLSPRTVLWTGSGVALSEVEDVVMANPALAVADLLARLRLGGDRPTGARIAQDCRQAYLAQMPELEAELALFEAAALLRVACQRSARESDAAPLELVRDELSVLLGRPAPMPGVCRGGPTR